MKIGSDVDGIEELIAQQQWPEPEGFGESTTLHLFGVRAATPRDKSECIAVGRTTKPSYDDSRFVFALCVPDKLLVIDLHTGKYAVYSGNAIATIQASFGQCSLEAPWFYGRRAAVIDQLAQLLPVKEKELAQHTGTFFGMVLRQVFPRSTADDSGGRELVHQ